MDAAPPARRPDLVAGCPAGAPVARPVLCDLISAQAAVLERNVSPQVAAYEEDPAPAALRPDFGTTPREAPEVLLSGLLARARAAVLGSW
ncbi:hypothetical protein AB0P12_00415 [Streptomyces subrutilus]|uniref:hypothetical protein n=1 Tax=Streptomyces subrutilus TaxID=36818 RepID=UPI003415D8AB